MRKGTRIAAAAATALCLTAPMVKADPAMDAKIEALVGQQVGAYVPPGEMVCTKDVKAVDLVKRGDDVTVVGGAGGVSMKLRGYALENGGYGETVKVQIGSSRKDRKVRRGVVTEFGKVKLLGE